MIELHESPSGQRMGVTIGLGAAAAVIAAIVLIRLLDLDVGIVGVASMAMLPYISVLSVFLAGLALALRRPSIAGIATILVIVLGTLMLPRAFGGPDKAAGDPLRVMTLNMYKGRADATEIADLVRSKQIDVLSLEELTYDALQRLQQAGIDKLMPYRVVDPTDRSGKGTGLLSRRPLKELDLARGTVFAAPSAQLDSSGSRPVQLIGFHARGPYNGAGREMWKADMAALPSPGGPGCRIIAGDFNATLDHPPLRKLISRGYRDVATVVGAGLRLTWWGGSVIPPMTIDHVLVSNPCGIRSLAVVKVNGTDHRALIATLIVPPLSDSTGD